MKTFAALNAYLAICAEAGTVPGVASVVDFVTKQLLNGDSYEHDTFTNGDVLDEKLLQQDLLSKIPSQLPANMIPEALEGIRENWNKSIQRRKDIGQEQSYQTQQSKTRQQDIKRELAPVSSRAPHFIYVDGNRILVEGALSHSELQAALNIVAESTKLKVMNKEFGIVPNWSSDSDQPVGYDILRDDGTTWFHIPKGPLSNHQLESLIYSKMTGKPSGVTASQLMAVWAAIEPQSIEAKAWLKKQIPLASTSSLRTKAAENAQFLRDHGFEGEAEDEEESNKGIRVRPV